MSVTTSNIVIPGPVIVYVAPASTAAPANTVAKGTTWGGSWVDVGATMDGCTLTVSTEKFEVMVDQYNAPVKDFITAQNAEMKFTAGEATLTNLKQALGYGTVTSGSTESTLGVGAVDGIGTNYSFGFECYAPGATSSASWYRRIIIWNGSPREVGDIEGKKDGVMGVQYSVKAIVDTSQTATERLYKVIDRVV
jgi:hypothetical protein